MARQLEQILGMKPEFISTLSPVLGINAGIGAMLVSIMYE
jgi:fatty acid-binding protein DegV